MSIPQELSPEFQGECQELNKRLLHDYGHLLELPELQRLGNLPSMIPCYQRQVFVGADRTWMRALEQKVLRRKEAGKMPILQALSLKNTPQDMVNYLEEVLHSSPSHEADCPESDWVNCSPSRSPCDCKWAGERKEALEAITQFKEAQRAES